MVSRRKVLQYTALAGMSFALPPGLLKAMGSGDMITRGIPASGEKLPIVGLGSSATFSSTARSDDVAALRDVLSALFEHGGTVVDTAPSYGASEDVAGGIVQALDATETVFWATKVNAAGRGNNSADPAAARAQLEKSFAHIGKDPIDLIQVHNLADLPTQYGILREYKDEGRVRYIGTTSTRTNRYPDLAKFMREHKPDFIGIDYAVDNLESAREILPLAEDLGIAVLGYVPFGRSRLFSRVKGVEVPGWAQEIGCQTWAQFFIKFAAAHPAMTVVTPATSKPKHMLDNLGAMFGELPDAATQRRMINFIDELPSA